MPRTIDHDERRAELLAAVWRVVLRGGVGEASVRKVAAEAGLSTGSVRYFFDDQRELLHAAVREVADRVRARARETAETREKLVAEGKVAEAVVRLLAQALPLDEDRLTEARVWFAFAAYGHDEVVQGIRRELDEELLALAEHCVESLAGCGALGAGRAKRAEALLLVAVVDGLTLRLLLNPSTLKPSAALDLLRTHVARLAAPQPAAGMITSSASHRASPAG